jgi:hypothetical protein
VDSQPHISQIEEQPKPGVHESEKHRRSKSYRSGDPTPSSLPADEYVTPTAHPLHGVALWAGTNHRRPHETRTPDLLQPERIPLNCDGLCTEINLRKEHPKFHRASHIRAAAGNKAVGARPGV